MVPMSGSGWRWRSEAGRMSAEEGLWGVGVGVRYMVSFSGFVYGL